MSGERELGRGQSHLVPLLGSSQLTLAPVGYMASVGSVLHYFVLIRTGWPCLAPFGPL